MAAAAGLGVDAAHCPLCGALNQCAIAAQTAASDCWCMQAEINPAALAALPQAALERACLCPRCAAGVQAATAPSA
ncbi:cysteine-rich CWC family protein [Silvimonas sp. JCM 19000]